jgi:hypothetical protein
MSNLGQPAEFSAVWAYNPHLDEDPAKAQKIVVLDDPFTSQG